MIVRTLAILVTLAGAVVGLACLIAEPEIPSAIVEKLRAGGMWTALAAFVAVAAVLGAWPRDAAGRLCKPFPRRRR